MREFAFSACPDFGLDRLYLGKVQHNPSRDTRQNAIRKRGRDQHPLLREQNARMASLLDKSIAREDRFISASLARLLPGENVRQQIDRFDVATRPALIGNENRSNTITALFIGW